MAFISLTAVSAAGLIVLSVLGTVFIVVGTILKKVKLRIIGGVFRIAGFLLLVPVLLVIATFFLALLRSFFG